MKIGYSRVSKHEQNEVLQKDALKEAECDTRSKIATFIRGLLGFGGLDVFYWEPVGASHPMGLVNPGFNGSWSGSNPSPTAFTLNGMTCSIG